MWVHIQMYNAGFLPLTAACMYLCNDFVVTQHLLVQRAIWNNK